MTEAHTSAFDPPSSHEDCDARAASYPWRLDVLLIEDDPADTSLIMAALRPHPNIASVCASDAPDQVLAALAAGEFMPDLVLLDIHMPRLDGFEFLENLRRIPDMVGVPVVFVTSSPLGREVVEAGLSSALSYFIKPASYPELQDGLDKVIIRLINRTR